MQTIRSARVSSRQPGLQVAPAQWRAARIIPRFRQSEANYGLASSIVRIPLEAPEVCWGAMHSLKQFEELLALRGASASALAWDAVLVG